MHVNVWKGTIRHVWAAEFEEERDWSARTYCLFLRSSFHSTALHRNSDLQTTKYNVPYGQNVWRHISIYSNSMAQPESTIWFVGYLQRCHTKYKVYTEDMPCHGSGWQTWVQRTATKSVKTLVECQECRLNRYYTLGPCLIPLGLYLYKWWFSWSHGSSINNCISHTEHFLLRVYVALLR